MTSNTDTQKTSISSETLTLRGHSGPVYGVCFSQDNSFILSASEDTSGRTNLTYSEHNFHVDFAL